MRHNDSEHSASKKLADILLKNMQDIPDLGKKGIVFDNAEYSETANCGQETYLEELFEKRESDLRFYNFAWLYLQFKEDAKFEETNFEIKEDTLTDIESFMLDELSSEKEAKSLAKKILREFSRRAVQPEKLAWTFEVRTSKWIKNKIAPFDQYRLKRLPNISEAQLTQAVFDLMDTSVSAKIAHLDELKNRWDQNLKTDHHLKWLDDKEHGKERRELAWAVICEKHPNLCSVTRTPSKYQEFLGIFDQLTDEGVSKKEFIAFLKGKESALKTANKGKKAKNLDILLENHPRLKQLAKQWKVHECVAMDRLISEAFEEEFGKEPPSED